MPRANRYLRYSPIGAHPVPTYELGISEYYGAGRAVSWEWFYKPRFDATIDQVQDIGATWLRQWASWNDLQSGGRGTALVQAGVDTLDYMLAAQATRGISTYMLIEPKAPAWANGSTSETPGWNANYGTAPGWIPGNSDIEDADFQQFVQDYCDFCVLLVNEFGDRVKHWEIWNEPDMVNGVVGGSGFWVFDNTGLSLQEELERAADAYYYMLTEAYAAIKAADPTANVICSSQTIYQQWYTDQLFTHDVDSVCDIVAVHPYTAGFPPEHTNPNHTFRAGMDRLVGYTGAKDIWITEVGFSQSGVESSSNHINNEDEQARHLARVMRIVADEYPTVQVLSVFRLRVDDSIAEESRATTRAYGYGITDTDYSEFTAYQAVKNAMQGR